jgi:hypothetical protein
MVNIPEIKMLATCDIIEFVAVESIPPRSQESHNKETERRNVWHADFFSKSLTDFDDVHVPAKILAERIDRGLLKRLILSFMKKDWFDIVGDFSFGRKRANCHFPRNPRA